MAKARILVVEDDKIISMEIKDRLENLGYEVLDVVFSGERAIEKATETAPDLVLMDIKLKGKMDGIEAAEKIRFLLDVPVVYLTAYTDENTLQRAKITEPYGYIVKPLEERELHSNIEIALYKHEAEKKIKESEERYRAIVESYDGFIYINTVDYGINFMNSRLKEFIGKGRKDGLCYELIYQRNSPCPWCSNDLVMQGKTVRKEIQSFKNDRWYYEVATPVHQPDGKILKQSMILDITERKRAEEDIVRSLEEKEIMLKEIHHRVKNNLQIISSLFRLQSTYVTDPAAIKCLKDSKDRVNSLALIHEKLYGSKDFTRIDFSSYIQQLANHLYQAYGLSVNDIKLNLKAHVLFLRIDTAIPCGLILNELLSNSLKHAFPNGRKGEIGIDFFSDSQGNYNLVIKDNGVGMPAELDVSKTESLGLQLVTTLTRQINGNLELNKNAGTEFKIIFKELDYKDRL
jgi:two-component sensor histidine kinase/AmiR/NasT family two-component response regulator